MQINSSFFSLLLQINENQKRKFLVHFWGIKREKVATPDQPGETHCGAKSGHFETSIIYFPRSKGVSEVSERANE